MRIAESIETRSMTRLIDVSVNRITSKQIAITNKLNQQLFVDFVRNACDDEHRIRSAGSSMRTMIVIDHENEIYKYNRISCHRIQLMNFNRFDLICAICFVHRCDCGSHTQFRPSKWSWWYQSIRWSCFTRAGLWWFSSSLNVILSDSLADWSIINDFRRNFGLKNLSIIPTMCCEYRERCPPINGSWRLWTCCGALRSLAALISSNLWLFCK